jgi:hypothetical protein
MLGVRRLTNWKSTGILFVGSSSYFEMCRVVCSGVTRKLTVG